MFNKLERIARLNPNAVDFERTKFNYGRKVDRLGITYKSGQEISVIRGDGTYGGKHGLFEIAGFTPKGEISKAVLGEYNTDLDCDPIGWLDEVDVSYYLMSVE